MLCKTSSYELFFESITSLTCLFDLDQLRFSHHYTVSHMGRHIVFLQHVFKGVCEELNNIGITFAHKGTVFIHCIHQLKCVIIKVKFTLAISFGKQGIIKGNKVLVLL